MTEIVPNDPIELQQRLAASGLENAQLYQQVGAQDDTIIQLRRTIHGKDAVIKTLKDGLGHDEAVEQLAAANATIVEAEFDVHHTASMRGIFRQIIKSYRELRITTALQQNAVVGAMIGRLQAEGERDAAVQEKDVIRQERDEAVELAQRTSILRNFYEQGTEQSRKDVADARQSEAKAWARADELSTVHTENEILREENEQLRASEVVAGAQIEPLQAELVATQTQLSQTEAELAEVRALIARKEEEAASVIQSLIDDLDKTKAENRTLTQQAKELKTERDRLKSQVGNLKREKGKTRGFNPFFWAR